MAVIPHCLIPTRRRGPFVAAPLARAALAAGAFLLVACSAPPAPAPPIDPPEPAAGSSAPVDPGVAAQRSPLPAATVDVPSSARSRAAVSRVEQRLEQELARRGLRLGDPVFIRIFKQDPLTGNASLGEGGLFEVWLESGAGYVLFRTYRICYFSGELGPKQRQGDNQAPEGFYSVGPAQMNPASRFHLSFNLGYPNRYDRAHRRTGSALMVHGECVSIGCFAMGNPGIEEIWTLTDAALRHQQPAIPVHIFPFRLTDQALESHVGSRWHPFWTNLREGYDAFEESHWPPRISVRERVYVIGPAAQPLGQ